MKRLLKWTFSLIAIGLMIVIALANRHPVTLQFDPFASNGSLQIDAPLYLLLIMALLLGILIGGASSWLKGSLRRKESRAYRRKEKQQIRQNETGKDVALPSSAGSSDI